MRMLKILKYLKKSIFTIIIIIGLLFLQAACDLTLPEYTSKIVNVGIQQGGVENACPEKIRKSEMDKILLFTTDSDKIVENYTLDGEVYALDDINKDTLAELNSIFERAILAVIGIESEYANADKINENVFDMLKVLPNEQKADILSKIDEKIADMPEMITKQAAIQFVKNEYSEIGIDIGKMQTDYIIYSRCTNARVSICKYVSCSFGYIASSKSSGNCCQRLKR